MKTSYEYAAVIINVVDGDTLDVVIDLGFKMSTIQRLRLARIDTPELDATTPEVRAKALAAKLFVLEFKGKSCMVKTTKTDSFGRYIAELVLEGNKNLSDLMLDGKYADPYRGK